MKFSTVTFAPKHLEIKLNVCLQGESTTRTITRTYLRQHKIKLWEPPYTSHPGSRANDEELDKLARLVSYEAHLSVGLLRRELDDLRQIALNALEERKAAKSMYGHSSSSESLSLSRAHTHI